MNVVLDPAPFFARAVDRAVDLEVARKRGNRHLWEVQNRLRLLGWPIPADNESLEYLLDAVQCFQEGFGLDRARLVVDRDPGPATLEALDASVAAHGQAWPNFQWREFRDKRTGWIRCRWEAAHALQTIRDVSGAPVFVVSALRSIASNKAAGSTSFPDPSLATNPWATNVKPGSRHIYGEALDITTQLKLGKVIDLGIASGYGVARWSGVTDRQRRIMHVDVGGMCRLGSNKYARPTVWTYPTR